MIPLKKTLSWVVHEARDNSTGNSSPVLVMPTNSMVLPMSTGDPPCASLVMPFW